MASDCAISSAISGHMAWVQDERLRPVPLGWHIRRLQREIEEREWSGEDTSRLRRELDAAKADEARGEMWYVPF